MQPHKPRLLRFLTRPPALSPASPPPPRPVGTHRRRRQHGHHPRDRQERHRGHPRDRRGLYRQLQLQALLQVVRQPLHRRVGGRVVQPVFRRPHRVRDGECRPEAGSYSDSAAELGTFGIFLFFQQYKMIFCIFYQVNLTGSGLFN